jgi:hypothetical protein
MGLSRLNVFVSGIDDPCGVDPRTWYITIYNCDGSVLEYCGRRYVVLRAPCGHLEIDVPPGCYYLKAVWGYTVITPGLVYRANHFTDAGIVTVCCDSHVCVKLFNPSVHRCGYIYVRAVRDLNAAAEINAAQKADVENAVQAVNDIVPAPAKLFELGHEDEIARLVAEQEGQGG